MPQLIRTPEDIFRAERRDVYALQFTQTNERDICRTRDEMQAWFAQHMPGSPTELLAPSEHSGFIVGGPVGLRIAFTDDDLQRFCQRWETPDGQSIDPRFQCYQYPYDRWWAKRGHYVPTLDQPSSLGAALWVETPLGVVSHVLPAEHNHPANVRDIWANACQQWPELQALDLEQLAYGKVVYSTHRKQWLLLWNAPLSEDWSESEKPERWRTVVDWLRLPADAKMASEF